MCGGGVCLSRLFHITLQNGDFSKQFWLEPQNSGLSWALPFYGAFDLSTPSVRLRVGELPKSSHPKSENKIISWTKVAEPPASRVPDALGGWFWGWSEKS